MLTFRSKSSSVARCQRPVKVHIVVVFIRRLGGRIVKVTRTYIVVRLEFMSCLARSCPEILPFDSVSTTKRMILKSFAFFFAVPANVIVPVSDFVVPLKSAEPLR